MFENFRRKLEKFIMCGNKIDYNEEIKKQDSEDTEEKHFVKKIVYKRQDKKNNFPEYYVDSEGDLIFSEKDKYFMAAQKIYDLAGVGEYIKIIEIKDNLDCSGECDAKIENDKLQITIRIDSKELGIVGNNGYIYKYSEKLCKNFTDVFAHELVHAKNSIDIIKAFGIEEYRFIKDKNNKISKMALHILDEYSACKEVAEKYNSFESTERIDRQIKANHLSIMQVIQNEEKVTTLMKPNIYALNYAIATRCAFADVSGNDAEHIEIPSRIFGNIRFEKYVKEIRLLLHKYYNLQPLNNEKYQNLGNEIMYELLSIYGVEKEKMGSIIQYLL